MSGRSGGSWLLVLVVAAAAMFGSASAQTADASVQSGIAAGVAGVGASSIITAVGSLGLAAGVEGGALAFTVGWGALVPFVGTAALTGFAIYTVIQNKCANDSTFAATAWCNWPSDDVYPVPTAVNAGDQILEVMCTGRNQYGYYIRIWTSYNSTTASWYAAKGTKQGTTTAQTNANLSSRDGRTGGKHSTEASAKIRAQDECALEMTTPYVPKPALGVWADTDGKREAIKTAIRDHYAATLPQSPAAPHPGMTTDPVPSCTQWSQDFTSAGCEGTDTDGDGFPDSEEVAVGTDPNDPNSKPKVCPDGSKVMPNATCPTQGDPNENPDGLCKYGYARNSAGMCKVDTDGDGKPDEEDPEPTNPNKSCPTGYTYNASTDQCLPTPVPDDPNDGGACQQIASAGLLGFVSNFWPSLELTGRCLFEPTVDVGAKLSATTGSLQGKFPFSVANALSFSAPSGEASLPTTFGMILVDWGPMATLWAVIKAGAGAVMWFFFAIWLRGRFTPSVKL